MDSTPRSRKPFSGVIKDNKKERPSRTTYPDSIKQTEQYELIKGAVKVLKRQREQGLKDIEVIKKRKAEILSDPDEYIYKLKNGTAPSFPPPQKIIVVSDIIKSGQFDDLLEKIKKFREQSQTENTPKISTPSTLRRARHSREKSTGK